jgi:hypothetical protein
VQDGEENKMMYEGFQTDYDEHTKLKLHICAEATPEQILKLTFQDKGEFCMSGTSNQAALCVQRISDVNEVALGDQIARAFPLSNIWFTPIKTFEPEKPIAWLMFEHVVDTETLLQDADRFMKTAQEAGKHYSKYEVDVRYATSEEMRDLRDLEQWKKWDLLLDSWPA